MSRRLGITPLPRTAAVALVVFLKEQARLLEKPASVEAPCFRRLRCLWVPNRSYGRLHEPLAGNEQFTFDWQWYDVDEAERDAKTHLPEAERGWRGCLEADALGVLMGLDPDLDAGLLLAERFR